MAFPETSIIDDFGRSNEGPPMTGWEDAYGSNIYSVSSNIALYNKPSTTFGGDIHTASNFDTSIGDVETYATMVQLGSDVASSPGVVFLCSNPGSSTLDGYLLEWPKNNSPDIYRIDNGAFTALDAGTAGTPANGYKLGVSVDGSGNFTVYVDTGGGWGVDSGFSITSTVYTAGNSGLWGYDAGNTQYIQLDDFGGGEVGGGSNSSQSGSLTSSGAPSRHFAGSREVNGAL